MSKDKISNITTDEVLDYIRVSPGDVDINEIEILMNVAKRYIRSETGEDPDSQPEFVEVYLLLVAHMFDHRTMVIDKDTVNPIVTSMLGHHRGNLLA